MRALTLILASAAVMSASPALAKKKPQISGLALQQIQAKDFDASKDVTFPAVMTVLQDAGYRIGSADRDTGLITGSASTKAKLTWAPFVGFGNKKKTPVVSAYIEERGAGSRIRLNFVLTKMKGNLYGAGLSDEDPITDAAIYKEAFEKIEKEIFVRQALNASKPAPVAVAPAAVEGGTVATATPTAAAPQE